MPNHVTTIILTSPEVVAAITREHTDEEKAEHAQRQAKMAASYKERTGMDWPLDDRLPDRFVDFELVAPSPPNKETDGCNDQHEPGVICWYKWNIENWGTKWNGYDTVVEPQPGDLCQLQFDTAWAHPIQIVVALSTMFPEDVLEVRWADEDLGYNVGSYKIKGGVEYDVKQPDGGSPEALELAAHIKHGKTYAEVKAEWES